MICLQCGAVIKHYIAGSVSCPKCGSIMSDEDVEDCPVCHGQGATTDHHDPCTECGGSGKVGG